MKVRCTHVTEVMIKQRHAENTDKRTHLVSPSSPVCSSTDLLLTVSGQVLQGKRGVEGWFEARFGEQDERAGRAEQVEEDAPGNSTVSGISLNGTPVDSVRKCTDKESRDSVGPKDDVGGG